MARPKTNFTVIDPGSGKARPGAFVTYYLANTLSKATLYADDDVSVLANPIQANGLGQVSVRVNPGLYDISMVWDGAQPTVVEDVLAWVPEGAVLQQQGDLIVGGVNGTPTRLALGQEDTVLMSRDGIALWWHLRPGDGLPDGGPGSLMTYQQSGATKYFGVLPPGLQDQALAIQGGQPEWVSTLIPPGTTLPINQPGDLVVGGAGGAVARLARGAEHTLLTVGETGLLEWTAADLGRGRGNCRISGTNSTTLTLHRHEGSELWVDGRLRIIPEAGVTISVAGLSADTTYYIYAAWVAGAMKLEASSTPYGITGGLAHKQGDESRTVVGMARTVPGPFWDFTDDRKFILSYFHSYAVTASGYLTAHRSLASGGLTEIHEEIRAEFLCWDFAATKLEAVGTVANGSLQYVYTALTLDGAPISLVWGSVQGYNPFSIGRGMQLSAGYHWLSLQGGLGDSGSGTVTNATWQGDAAGIAACRTNAITTG